VGIRSMAGIRRSCHPTPQQEIFPKLEKYSL